MTASTNTSTPQQAIGNYDNTWAGFIERVNAATGTTIVPLPDQHYSYCMGEDCIPHISGWLGWSEFDRFHNGQPVRLWFCDGRAFRGTASQLSTLLHESAIKPGEACCPQTPERDRLLHRAREMRELASRGFRALKHTAEAQRLEAMAEALTHEKDPQ